MRVKFLVFITLLSIANAYAKVPSKLIPSPSLETDSINLAPNQSFTINGKGFILNHPKAHQVFLKQGKRKHKLEVLASTATQLELRAPARIAYGDYDLVLRLRTRLLRSKASKLTNPLRVRPTAPPKPVFSHAIIKDLQEFEQVNSLLRYKNNDLVFSKDKLELGLNEIRTSYYKDGWESLSSEPSYIYYLPANELESSLVLESENPLKTFVIAPRHDTSFDLSVYTKSHYEDLSKSFFVTTPSDERYLEYIIKLKPIFIERIHVTAPEYGIIVNRSAEDFSLAGCSLSDAVRARYFFAADEILTAKSSMTIEANLGLNDSTPDHLSLDCADEQIDIFKYLRHDTDGYGIRVD
jgi:hypothetical protein